MMKASTDGTWKWINFDTGETWILDRYNYVKLLQVLLTPKQFEKDFERDGNYTISNKRYLKAKEYYNQLKSK